MLCQVYHPTIFDLSRTINLSCQLKTLLSGSLFLCYVTRAKGALIVALQSMFPYVLKTRVLSNFAQFKPQQYMFGLNQCLRLVRNLSFWMEKKNYGFLVDRIGIGKKGRQENQPFSHCERKCLEKIQPYITSGNLYHGHVAIFLVVCLYQTFSHKSSFQNYWQILDMGESV
jgi:hypothetical protein